MMKNLSFLLLLLMSSHFSFGQELSFLTDGNLIQKGDLKKKSGWIKLELDVDFNEVSDQSGVAHEMFEFCNRKGQYNSTYSKSLGFPPPNSKVSYEPFASDNDSKLLNGRVKFYHKDGLLSLCFVFNSGFLVKVSEFSWKGKYEGKAKTVVEYIPSLKSVELYANYYDEDGLITGDSHEQNDGERYITLPGNKIIVQ